MFKSKKKDSRHLGRKLYNFVWLFHPKSELCSITLFVPPTSHLSNETVGFSFLSLWDGTYDDDVRFLLIVGKLVGTASTPRIDQEYLSQIRVSIMSNFMLATSKAVNMQA